MFQLPLIKAGDTVQVLSDRAEVERLQDGHGGWVNQMEGVNIPFNCYFIEFSDKIEDYTGHSSFKTILLLVVYVYFVFCKHSMLSNSTGAW